MLPGIPAVPTDGYTASAGSVNISLKASWLNSLSEGAHQLKVSLKDGSAETSFTVAAGKKQPDVPKTGDNANLLLWLGMVLLGLLGICGLSVVRNRK